MPDETSVMTAAPTPVNNNVKWVYIAIAAVLVGFLVYRWFNKDNNEVAAPVPATVAGTVVFNGLTPEDFKDLTGYSGKLMAQVYGTTEWFDTNTPFTPAGDARAWTWAGAESGKTYSIKTDVVYQGSVVKSSNTVTTTAPATNVPLVLNITLADVPDTVVKQAPVTVAGTVTLNGYVPDGSYINIYGRKSESEDAFKNAIQKVPGYNGAVWSYTNAEFGQEYEMQAELYTSSGTFIGQSNYMTVAAPAQNVLVTINSTATAPSQAALISGTVILNGPVESNSTVLVLQRKTGAADYTPVDRYPAQSKVPFEFPNAVAGQAYDITAALQVNEQNTATGNVVTITAPAGSVNVTIDTGVSIATPTQTVSVDCGGSDDTNHYNAKISLPQMEKAQTYYLEVGTAAGSNNVFRDTVAPNSSATVYIAGQAPYFARYTYSNCTDCDMESNSNWAGWSPTLGFTCPSSATP